MNKSIRISLQSAMMLASAVLMASPTIAQAQTQASAGSGTVGNSSYSTGRQTNGVTGTQNYFGGTNPWQTPVVRGGMNAATNGLMAPASTDNSSVPSGSFSYGFGGGGATPYMGVSNRIGSGAALPATSTSSVDANTCDLPFIQGPGEGCGSSSIMPIALTNPGVSAAINAGTATMTFTVGNIGASVTTSTSQNLGSLQNYFNGP